jgi:hypothetical protein
MSASCPDYDDLKRMAQELKRPVETLIALAKNNDPFFAGLPSNRADGEWFAKLWQEYGINRARHIRRIHYVLQAQPHGSVLMRDGIRPYENTDECWNDVLLASKYARVLGLVAPEALVDRRNPEPMLFARARSRDTADLWVSSGGSFGFTAPDFPKFPDPPSMYLTEPARKRPILNEVWVEKSGDLDDVLVPLCERRGANLIPCKGEQGMEACRKVVNRALEARCPVRILYLSDFDPAGQSMPVAVARKIEFEIRKRGLELDIQVRPIGLTHEQCVRYRLPRVPIKESERRAGRFEDRFGAGATELDALEALHPGELGKIVEHEIARYQTIDPKTNRRFFEVSSQVRRELQALEESVMVRHHDVLEELLEEYERIRDDHAQVIADLKEWSERIEDTHQRIREDLTREQPDLSEWQWPDPSEPDEDPDPLFDSRRSYLEQINRYKAHQGKPIGRRKRSGEAAP